MSFRIPRLKFTESRIAYVYAPAFRLLRGAPCRKYYCLIRTRAIWTSFFLNTSTIRSTRSFADPTRINSNRHDRTYRLGTRPCDVPVTIYKGSQDFGAEGQMANTLKIPDFISGPTEISKRLALRLYPARRYTGTTPAIPSSLFRRVAISLLHSLSGL